jgi:hypothetical protein
MSLEFFAFFFLLGAIAVLMPPGIAILICFVVSTIAIAIFMAKSISIWFWFISGAILLLVLIKNSFSDITDDDDRIIDRSNVEQQTYLRKKK